MGLGKVKDTMSDARELQPEEKMEKVIRLDLACGDNKKSGFIGIDIAETEAADYVTDLFQPEWMILPNPKQAVHPFLDLTPHMTLQDSSIFEVFSAHFIEHVPGDCMAEFANELYRVLIPGGRTEFIAPYYSSMRAMQDPTHKSFISEHTFLYWNKAWRDANKLSHYGFSCNFAIMSVKYIYNPEWVHRSEPAKEYARKFNINVVDDIEVILKAIK